MINSNSADLLKSKLMPKSTEVKGKSQRKNIKKIPIDDVSNATNSVINSAIVENQILKYNDKIRTQIEDKIKSVKHDVFKWVGIISIVIAISFATVTAVLTYLVKSYTEEIKLIPVHENKIEQLEKKFDKFCTNKKC